MKNEEQIKRRIKRLEERIEQLESRFDKSGQPFIINEIKRYEEKIELLNWVLGAQNV